MSHSENFSVRNLLQKPADMVTHHYLSRLRKLGLPNANQITALPDALSALKLRCTEIGLFCCDWDGVIKQGYFDGLNGNEENNKRNLCALKTMTGLSEQVVIWSSRIHVPEMNLRVYAALEAFLGTDEGISHFPFVTGSDLRALSHELLTENPHVNLDLQFGFSKAVKKSCNMAERIGEVLQQNKQVVVVGSSLIDHVRMEGIVRYCTQQNIPLTNLHYFTTGRISW